MMKTEVDGNEKIVKWVGEAQGAVLAQVMKVKVTM